MYAAVDTVDLLRDFVGHFYLPEVKIVLNLPMKSAEAGLSLWHLGLRCVEEVLHELVDQGNVLLLTFLYQGLVIVGLGDQ